MCLSRQAVGNNTYNALGLSQNLMSTVYNQAGVYTPTLGSAQYTPNGYINRNGTYQSRGTSIGDGYYTNLISGTTASPLSTVQYGNSYSNGYVNTNPTQSQSSARGMNNLAMGLTLLGGLANYRTNNSYLNAQSAALDSNIAQTYQQINQEGIRGATAANDQRRRGRQTIATQTANYGASGVAGGDTVNRVRGGTAYNAETNAQREEYNSNVRMWAMTQNIENMRAQQRAIEAQKSNNKLGTILTTATQLAKMYYGWGGVG